MIDTDLKLLGVDIHLEQGVAEDVSKATSVEVAVRSAVVLVIVDVRELKAAVLQQLVVVKFLVGHVNLQGHRRKPGFLSDRCSFYILVQKMPS